MADEAKPAGGKRAAAKKADPEPAAPAAPAKPAAKNPTAPRRPTVDPALRRLLGVRDALDDARPRFTRQASYRYYRIGRDGSWRAPRGLQSKQRRHYKYRAQVVRIGYGSPGAVRGLTPSGFRPVVVRTAEAIEALDVAREAAIIGRTVGTRRRLVLEEVARRRGVHVLNPLVKDRGEA